MHVLQYTFFPSAVDFLVFTRLFSFFDLASFVWGFFWSCISPAK